MRPKQPSNPSAKADDPFLREEDHIAAVVNASLAMLPTSQTPPPAAALPYWSFSRSCSEIVAKAQHADDSRPSETSSQVPPRKRREEKEEEQERLSSYVFLIVLCHFLRSLTTCRVNCDKFQIFSTQVLILQTSLDMRLQHGDFLRIFRRRNRMNQNLGDDDEEPHRGFL